MARIFILSIMAIGAVSASEDISDDVAAIEPADEVVTEAVAEEPSDELEVQSIGEENLDSDMLGADEDEIINSFDVTIPEDTSDEIAIHPKKSLDGTLGILVNDEEKKRCPFNVYQYVYVDFYDLGFYEFASGLYTVKVNYIGNDGQTNVTVAQKTIPYLRFGFDEPDMYMDSDEIVNFTLKLPDVNSGNITLYSYNDNTVGAELGSADIINNAASIKLSGLPVGFNRFFIKFSTDIVDGNTSISFYVFENTENVAVSVPAEIIQGDKSFVTVKSNETANAFIIVDGNITKYSDVSSVSHAIPSLSVGTHTVRVVFVINPGSSSPFYSKTFNVIVKAADQPNIVAKDYSAYYNKGTYSATVYGTDGKVASGVNVVFKINGKKIATVKTNSKGVAKIKIPVNYAPKTYKISVTALGKTVTKKLVVKQVLTLKKVTVKKSSNKLVVTATLKEGKKAIKGKKITFLFNGKKYTAKTNNKGIAKTTIKKAVLKKLKVGKKVTYKATYLKDTVKRTVKVKK